jgi:hypothetical protein
VLIPAYQAADVVGDALRSLVAQTEPPVQVLVVDDGSTDDLKGALQPFADRVRLVRVAHLGLPAARNVGLQHAVGDFVAFLDADDAFEPEFLAALGSLSAARPDLDVLTTDATFVVDGRDAGTFAAANPFPISDQRLAVLTRCFITTKSAVRRSRLAEIGGFDARLTHGEDWDCWIRLVLAGARVGMVDAPLSRYRLHDGQLSARRAASLQGRYEVMAGLLDRDDLTEGERRAVSDELGRLRLRVALAAAREAEGAARRQRWWAVARLPDAPRRVRAAAAVAALLPHAARLTPALRAAPARS